MGRLIGHNDVRDTTEPFLQQAPTLPQRPDVYPGTVGTVAAERSQASGQRNRRIVRRRISPFSIVLLLIGTAIGTVLYIGNIIAVDQLMNEINSLETQHRRILMEQEIMKAQINKMASLERIQELAERELDLIVPKEPPVWLTIDPEKARRVEEEVPKP